MQNRRLIDFCAFALFFVFVGLCLKIGAESAREGPGNAIKIKSTISEPEPDETKSAIRDSLFMESSTFLKHINLELSEPETYLIGLSDLYLILDHEVLPVSQKLRSAVFSTIKKAYNATRLEEGVRFRPQIIEILEKSLKVWPNDEQEKRIKLWLWRSYEKEGKDPSQEKILQEVDKDVQEKTKKTTVKKPANQNTFAAKPPTQVKEKKLRIPKTTKTSKKTSSTKRVRKTTKPKTSTPGTDIGRQRRKKPTNTTASSTAGRRKRTPRKKKAEDQGTKPNKKEPKSRPERDTSEKPSQESEKRPNYSRHRGNSKTSKKANKKTSKDSDWK
ncbi:hypothetical protein ACFLY6_03110 [Candidatus Dependentiae bacterium]